MLSNQQAEQILNDADLLYSADVVTETVQRMANEITEVLSGQCPLVLCVMSGAVVFSGQLLPLFRFPLDFDYLHVTRYNGKTRGGMIQWQTFPRNSLQGRTVLVLDDILDEGITLAAIQEKVMACGAGKFYSAVFAEKNLVKPKPLRADFVGLTIPDRYVFGFGMDIYGAWRNLPAIYAMKD
ncbi:MAG: hypoxanthine-guanine phosphoribosyltransferase [Betaproteobacteria bacterium]|nr:hypoxanthine-guanine phosphoribosyltransferase [Betaproteobacteria bacterium]